MSRLKISWLSTYRWLRSWWSVNGVSTEVLMEHWSSDNRGLIEGITPGYKLTRPQMPFIHMIWSVLISKLINASENYSVQADQLRGFDSTLGSQMTLKIEEKLGFRCHLLIGNWLWNFYSFSKSHIFYLPGSCPIQSHLWKWLLAWYHHSDQNQLSSWICEQYSQNI